MLRGSLENRCTAVVDGVLRATARGDWAALDALMTDDSRWIDRRQGLGVALSSREERIRNLQEVANLGAVGSSEPIATRGQSLALARHTFVVTSGSDSFDVVMLALDELGPDGRLSWSASFDVDDLDSAFAELDARFVSGEGSPWATVVTTLRSTWDGLNTDRWGDVASVFAEDVVYVDHRRGPAGLVRGRQPVVDVLRTTDPPHVRQDIVAFHALDERCALVESRGRGTAHGSGDPPDALYVIRFARNDTIDRVERFDLDDAGSAMTRFAGSAEPGA